MNMRELLGKKKEFIEKKIEELGIDELVCLDDTRAQWDERQWKNVMLLTVLDTACSYRVNILNENNSNRQKQVKILKILFWVFHFTIPFIILASVFSYIIYRLFFD